jgi:sec-independent protein translocase protein TatA
MFRNIGAPEIIIIAVLLILIFGWKRLPDAARSLGRSMRVFKSEVGEMKNDGKSAASSDTVKGETVRDTDARAETRTQGGAEGTSALREDNSPRSDNSSGAA